MSISVALASAQQTVPQNQTVQDPGTTQVPGPQSDAANTTYTPAPGDVTEAAKQGWRQVGGAIFNDDPTLKNEADQSMGYRPDASPTPPTVDFFTVSFRTPDDGFAAGAACKDPNTPNTDDALLNCRRVPVIYRYSKPSPNDPPRWSEVYRGSDSTGDGQGFVGAIAWIPNEDRAVAVGGDGCYPRREVSCPPTNEPAKGANAADPIAGDGRAWQFDGSSWTPISPLPGGMTGLTALDFSPRPSDCGAVAECGFAGAKGQLWMWKDFGFASKPAFPTAGTPSDPTQPGASPFRVRSIKFAPGSGGKYQALAVTAGCCDTVNTQAAANFPRLLSFSASQWTSSGLFQNSTWSNGHTATLPDSMYSLTFSGVKGDNQRFSVISTPGGGAGQPVSGGPDRPVEPASRIIGPLTPGANLDSFAPGGVALNVTVDSGQGPGDSDLSYEALTPQLSSVRLVAADGDFEGHQDSVNGQVQGPQFVGPDGLPDWAVGELRSTGQAIADSTVEQARALRPPSAVNCPNPGVANNLPPGGAPGACQPNTTPQNDVKSHYLFSLPSYPLNAYTTNSGVGWAVGDRGALVTLSGGVGDQSASGVKPPKLGGSQTTRLSNREGYDAFRPSLSAEPGVVPPLGAQPVTKLAAPQLVPAGSPWPQANGGGTQAVAMSRDGSEGWAVGPDAELDHFDGERWTRCDPAGISGALASAPACASLSQLVAAGAKILSIARVPLELGGDQSRADDFEAMALAKYPNGPVAALLYRGGAWSIDQDWSQQLAGAASFGLNSVELAFGTPDDGWLVVKGPNDDFLWHLSGNRWAQCGDATSSYKDWCDDPDGLIPTNKSGTTNSQTNARSGFASGLHVTTLGKHVYLYGTRTGTGALVDEGQSQAPVILSLDAGADHPQWTPQLDPASPDATSDPNKVVPYDNGGTTQPASQFGTLNSLSLAQGPDGSVTGWGAGDFHSGTPGTPVVPLPNPANTPLTGPHTPLIQLNAGTGRWAFVSDPGPAADEYLLPQTVDKAAFGSRDGRSKIVALPGGGAVAVPVLGTISPTVWRNPASGRWEVFPTPFETAFHSGDVPHLAGVSGLAPDNRGGLWLVAGPYFGHAPWFYHYTDRVNAPVFSDVPQPIREPITATASGGDGSFWVATASGTVYRYDRLTGWDQVAMKGWDAGGAVASPAYAIAVGENGEGVAVGSRGRIADLAPKGVALDPAASLCSSQPQSCGGGHALRAAAVAPDGSALVGGDDRTLLWRPAGASFNQIGSPPGTPSATITGIAMPAPDQAWLATDAGDVFAGSLSGGSWQWTREDVGADGRILARDANGQPESLRAIAVDAAGHGYAVGDDGVILERTGGAQAWRRVATGYRDNLRSVTLGPGGKGALLGGDGGLVLTLTNGRFEVARASDYFDPLVTGADPQGLGRVVGVALMPGYKSGDLEAWAAVQVPSKSDSGAVTRSPAPGAILHYTNDPSNPLLAGGAGRATAVPYTPQHQSGEIDIAAFGKSDCQLQSSTDLCPEFTGSNMENEVIARRIRDTLTSGPDRPDFAVFTGDVNGAAGRNSGDQVDTAADASLIHERWAEQIAGPFVRAGVPLYGAVGGQDLSNSQACIPLEGLCVKTHTTRAGLNLAWRAAFAGADAPWGGATPSSSSGLSFQPVSDGNTPNTSVVPVDTHTVTGPLPTDGAHTHYAVDVERGGNKVLRLVVVDTSLKTLAGTGGTQNPVEDQLRWLDDVLSSRPSGERATVVSETPSYTYGTAGTATDTLLDSAAFETVLVKDHVDAVLSGRLGWNGLYWIEAPGLHSPCAGQSYQEQPPTDPTRSCQGGDQVLDGANQVAQALQGLNAPVNPPSPTDVVNNVAGQVIHPIPVAVAASAGGKFGPDGSSVGNASDGFWHGYSLLRMFDNGSYAVEQRPIFDWIGLTAKDHAINPGQSLNLSGYGREPVGIDQPIRYDDINGPAISHQYNLVLADSQKPYLPAVDPASANKNHYVSLPPIGASIDPQTGQVKYTGNGNHPAVYAVAILSVGNQVATWPVVFMPKRSFHQTPPPPQRVAIPPLPRVEAAVPATLPPTPPAQVPNPPPLNLTFPTAPPLPNLTLNAPSAQPPVPPAPPPPPASPTASALQITPAPVGLNVAPPATVIPPPAPPIQPAPPSGARREARQRQAAVAKSEEGAQQESATQEAEGGGGGGGNQSASTRLNTRRDDYSFTAVQHPGQSSAWPRDLLYGGGLGLAALTLALGWGMVRPGPRRKEPDLPAPAWAPSRRDR